MNPSSSDPNFIKPSRPFDSGKFLFDTAMVFAAFGIFVTGMSFAGDAAALYERAVGTTARAFVSGTDDALDRYASFSQESAELFVAAVFSAGNLQVAGYDAAGAAALAAADAANAHADHAGAELADLLQYGLPAEIFVSMPAPATGAHPVEPPTLSAEYYPASVAIAVPPASGLSYLEYLPDSIAEASAEFYTGVAESVLESLDSAEMPQLAAVQAGPQLELLSSPVVEALPVEIADTTARLYTAVAETFINASYEALDFYAAAMQAGAEHFVTAVYAAGELQIAGYDSAGAAALAIAEAADAHAGDAGAELAALLQYGLPAEIFASVPVLAAAAAAAPEPAPAAGSIAGGFPAGGKLSDLQYLPDSIAEASAEFYTGIAEGVLESLDSAAPQFAAVASGPQVTLVSDPVMEALPDEIADTTAALYTSIAENFIEATFVARDVYVGIVSGIASGIVQSVER